MSDKPPTVHAKNYGKFHGVNKDDLETFAAWHRERAFEEAAHECDIAARTALTVEEAQRFEELARRIRAKALEGRV
jgi:hypothetical protein